LEAVYLGGNHKNVKHGPLDPVVPGGFPICRVGIEENRAGGGALNHGVEVDWPDSLDPQTGESTYYAIIAAPTIVAFREPVDDMLILRLAG
jgi:hypothetical protein